MELLALNSIFICTRSNELFVMQIANNEYLEPPKKIMKLEAPNTIKVMIYISLLKGYLHTMLLLMISS